MVPGTGKRERPGHIRQGNKNPSGKLPTTFPRRIEDTPTYANYPGKNGAVHYREGIFVGYRHYDKQNIDPLFPFGHGLSYTTFEYSDLYLSKTEISPGENITLSFILKNTGLEAGNEVVQIYIRKEGSSVDHPDKELKYFQKIWMEADEISQIDIDLKRSILAYYDEATSSWTTEAGKYSVLIGSSSRDIRLSDTFHLIDNNA